MKLPGTRSHGVGVRPSGEYTFDRPVAAGRARREARQILRMPSDEVRVRPDDVVVARQGRTGGEPRAPLGKISRGAPERSA